MRPRTRAVHPPLAPLAPDNRPLVAPIYQSVKFELDTLAQTERVWRHETPGYSYSRGSNPSTRALELAIADLQGTEDALVVGSGMAAVAAVFLSLLATGGHVLLFVESYVPTRLLVRDLLARFGVTHTLLSIEDRAGIERELDARPTALVWLESPTNPLLRIADIAHLVGCAQRAGALTALDNTFAGPHQHVGLGIDLYVHSLTKYASGHGDVMAGAVAGSAALVARVRRDSTLLGPTLDPHAAFLVSRGLKSYPLRRSAACESAATVARFLDSHPFVHRVHYPGLATHPGHELARAQMSDFGSVVTIELKGTPAQARVFTDQLKLFSIAASLGSTESLIVPPQLMSTTGLSADARRLTGITSTTARLSIGLEDPEDLVEDLTAALAAASAAEQPQ